MSENERNGIGSKTDDSSEEKKGAKTMTNGEMDSAYIKMTNGEEGLIEDTGGSAVGLTGEIPAAEEKILADGLQRVIDARTREVAKPTV